MMQGQADLPATSSFAGLGGTVTRASHDAMPQHIVLIQVIMPDPALVRDQSGLPDANLVPFRDLVVRDLAVLWQGYRTMRYLSLWY
jgi:hypothetical protein